MTLNITRLKIPHICITDIPRSPKFQSISIHGQPFLRYRQFWEKCTEWHQNDLEPCKIKCTIYVLLVIPRRKFQFPSIASRFRVADHFETNAKKMPEIYNWNFTILLANLVDTLPRSRHEFGEQIWCILSKEISFENSTPIWSHANENGKNMAKVQNLKFHNSLNNTGRDSLEVCMTFWEWIWCVLSEEMSFEILNSIWPYVNENKKKT